MLTPCDIVFQLKPCTWRYNTTIPGLGDKIHYGFLAQDLVYSFGDEYGFVDTTGEYMKVNYGEFIAPLTKVVQDQEQRIIQLEQQLKELYEQFSIRTGRSSGSRIPLVCDECDEKLTGQSGEPG